MFNNTFWLYVHCAFFFLAFFKLLCSTSCWTQHFTPLHFFFHFMSIGIPVQVFKEMNVISIWIFVFVWPVRDEIFICSLTANQILLVLFPNILYQLNYTIFIEITETNFYTYMLERKVNELSMFLLVSFANDLLVCCKLC